MLNKGFLGGLLPPTFGCIWQDWQELELKRGPRPLPVLSELLLAPLTTSTAPNRVNPSWKNANASAPNPAIG
jgi:hypothetical protein